jgi:hypothetical protein
MRSTQRCYAPDAGTRSTDQAAESALAQPPSRALDPWEDPAHPSGPDTTATGALTSQATTAQHTLTAATASSETDMPTITPGHDTIAATTDDTPGDSDRTITPAAPATTTTVAIHAAEVDAPHCNNNNYNNTSSSNALRSMAPKTFQDLQLSRELVAGIQETGALQQMTECSESVLH